NSIFHSSASACCKRSFGAYLSCTVVSTHLADGTYSLPPYSLFSTLYSLLSILYSLLPILYSLLSTPYTYPFLR
ncbi:hypothetical protein FBQ83_15510, partial [Chloroflexi bacterium CFX5]|nr:hypothetical protein [Chloroflexi bacterium CFX5]